MKAWFLPCVVAVVCAGMCPPRGDPQARGRPAGGPEPRIIEAVTSLGRDGDWLVVRGYKPTDDLIAGLVNAPISHVGVLDLGRRR